MATLARWNDREGRSQGWWLVREVPGLCIYITHRHLSWCLQAIDPDEVASVFNLEAESDRVWGPGADLYQAVPFLEQMDKTVGFKTREAARQAVGRRLAELEAAPSALGQLL